MSSLIRLILRLTERFIGWIIPKKVRIKCTHIVIFGWYFQRRFFLHRRRARPKGKELISVYRSCAINVVVKNLVNNSKRRLTIATLLPHYFSLFVWEYVIVCHRACKQSHLEMYWKIHNFWIYTQAPQTRLYFRDIPLHFDLSSPFVKYILWKYQSASSDN